jgi:hypothetical protein
MLYQKRACKTLMKLTLGKLLGQFWNGWRLLLLGSCHITFCLAKGITLSVFYCNKVYNKYFIIWNVIIFFLVYNEVIVFTLDGMPKIINVLLTEKWLVNLANWRLVGKNEYFTLTNRYFDPEKIMEFFLFFITQKNEFLHVLHHECKFEKM